MKTVEFKGQEFEAPYWCKYLVNDVDGSVWAYDDRPQKQSCGDWDTSSYGGRKEKIGWLEDPDCKWVG